MHDRGPRILHEGQVGRVPVRWWVRHQLLLRSVRCGSGGVSVTADNTKPWLRAIMVKLEEDRAAIEDEIGPFTWRENNPHEEIILILQPGPGARRAYVVEDRLVVDDYFPLDSERQ